MSNGLLDVMKYCADEKVKSANIPHYVSGVITSVSEDMFRADIKLEQDQVLKNMLNKSGEELEVGDTVWVEYFTYPSSGWIARRNGKPKPMGGGGASTTVETATVLTDDNFHDFVIEEEVMVDIVPPNRIYYGAHPSFCIIQGHYCLMSNGGISYDTETGKWTIGGVDGVYEKIIENKDKFGTQIGTQEGGGWLYHGSSTIAYPTKYGCISCEIYSMIYSSNGIRIQTLARRWTADTVEPSGNWWESEMTWGTLAELTTTGGYYTQYLKTPDNDMYWASPLKDIFIVPCVSFYNTPTSGSQSKRKHPYGYIVMNNYIVFASADGINYGVTQLMSTSNDQLLFAYGALISEAENAFTLGISKRSEPIIDGGGG